MATTAEIFHFLLNQQRDAAGILESGSALFYEAGTSNLKDVWTDRDKNTVSANPATLAQDGTVAVYGDGTYRVVIKDSDGVVVHDYPAIEMAFVSNNLATIVSDCEAAQTAAETAETNAGDSETGAVAALADFEDVYQVAATAPTENVDVGDLYHNTTDGFMYVCSSTGPAVWDKIDSTAYTHPSYDGDDFSSDTGALSGAFVVSDIDINLSSDATGHVTDANCSIATRELPSASITTEGLVELATTTEAAAGTDTDRAVTAAGVKAYVDDTLATVSSKGIVELATTAEAAAGVDIERAVTAAGVKQYVDDNGGSGFTTSHAANGYVEMPDGTIIQWGTYTSTQDAAETFNFPVAFPNGCFSAQLNRTGSDSLKAMYIYSTTTTQFIVNRDDVIQTDQDFTIIAIGY